MGWRVKLSLVAILLLALVLRLKGLFNPLLDDQGWRQADTACMALNMLGHLGNFPDVLFPMLNYDGPEPQNVELEMPILPYLLALTWTIFGWADYWGRLWAIFFSLITVLGVYEFGKRILSEKTGLIAALCYAVIPLSIYYGRVVMPEPVAQAFSIWALNSILIWKKSTSHRKLKLLLASLLMAGAILAKLPQLMIFPVALCIGFWPLKEKKSLVIYSFIALSLPFAYYLGVHQVSKASSQFVSGIISNQVISSSSIYTEALIKNLNLGIGLPVILLAVIGMIRLCKFSKINRGTRLGIILWGIISLFYVFIICQRIALDYYLIPIALPIAILVGIALDSLDSILTGLIVVLLTITLLVGFNIEYDSKYEWNNKYLTQGIWLRENTENTDVLILSDSPPMTFYYANRYGYRLNLADVDLAWQNLHSLQGDYLVKLPTSEDSSFWLKIEEKYPKVGPGVYRLVGH